MKKLLVIGLFVFGMILPNIDVKAVSIGGVDVDVVTSGDGLYSDEYTEGRYVYRGANPDNYIKFNNELWRIIAKEADGTYKLVRNELLPEQMPFDRQGYRDSESNGAGGTYCEQSSDGCNAWAANANLVGSPAEFTNTMQTGTVLLDSSLNVYLNGEYYDGLSSEARGLITSHDWGVGAVATYNNNNLATQILGENSYKWNGKVGLISHSDYLNANSNQELCGTQESNSTACRGNDWMYISGTYWWTLSPNNLYVVSVWGVGDYLYNNNAYDSYGVRPSVYLSSDITLCGDGNEDNPYEISDKCDIEQEETSTEEANNNTSNENNLQIVEVPSTSAYGSIIIAVLGIICVIVSVFVTRKVTKKVN